MLNVPEYIIVHHTGGTTKNPRTDTSHHTFDIVRNYHLSLNWEDIGYHYFIEKDGALKAGRAENYHGAHTKGMNTRSLGVCLAGNFDVTLPTDKQIASLTGLLKALSKRYMIPRENIVPHRHFASKSCYGFNLPDEWASRLVDSENIKGELIALSEKLADLAYKL